MDTIRIQGVDFSYKEDENISLERGCRGQVFLTKAKIFVDSDMPQVLKAQALLHELIEVLNYHFEMNLKHENINQLDAGLTQIFRDNPELRDMFFPNEDK